MALQFVCECGKRIRVGDDMVGKRVRCPACQGVITVPTEDGGDEQDDRPRRRPRGKSKRKSSTIMYVGIGAGVLLLSCCCLGGLVGGIVYFAPSDKVLTGEGKGSKLILEQKGTWTPNDPIHPEQQSAYKTYSVNLQAGKAYTIDLKSTQLGQDPYLYLTDSTGKVLAQDDDSGGGIDDLDARIVFVPAQTGQFRIIATQFAGNKSLGNFMLTVREDVKGSR